MPSSGELLFDVYSISNARCGVECMLLIDATFGLMSEGTGAQPTSYLDDRYLSDADETQATFGKVLKGLKVEFKN